MSQMQVCFGSITPVRTCERYVHMTPDRVGFAAAMDRRCGPQPDASIAAKDAHGSASSITSHALRRRCGIVTQAKLQRSLAFRSGRVQALWIALDRDHRTAAIAAALLRWW